MSDRTKLQDMVLEAAKKLRNRPIERRGMWILTDEFLDSIIKQD